MNAESGIKIFNIRDTEGIETGEGIMKPFLVTDNVSLIHLEIPAGMNITPHAHHRQGLLYCLDGELEIVSRNERFIIAGGTAAIVFPDIAIGVNNNSDSSANCLLISSPPAFKSAEELKERLKQIGVKNK